MSAAALEMLRILCWPRQVDLESAEGTVRLAMRDLRRNIDSMRRSAESMDEEWKNFEVLEAIRRDETRLALLREWKALI